MFNKVILAGNLTRDIEIRYTQGGSAVGNTAIATTRKFKAATGEQKEEVMFIDLTFFARSAEIANQYTRKGSKVLVEGRLKLDQWDDQQTGQKRSKHSVIVENFKMLGGKEDGQSHAAPSGSGAGSDQYNGGYAGAGAGSDQYSPPSSPAPQPTSNIPEIDINEDEIPF